MQVFVLTGASGGMGRELCGRLAREGIGLALCSNDTAGLKKLASELSGYGAKIRTLPVDVTDETQVEDFFAMVRAEFGRADILLNLAGLSIPAQIPDMAVEDFDRIVEVNLKGTFLCSKHFAPLVDPSAGGKIINIGSMAAHRANGNAPVYCAVKAAVNMLSQGMALQLKEKNIQVTTLNPGGTDTAFWGDRPVAREKLMRASDVADVLEFVIRASGRIVFHEINFESFIR